VARTYAAVMALLGMIVVLMRAMKEGAGLDGTIENGLVWMILLGAVGLLVGAIAQATVDESVRTKIEAELAALDASRQKTTTTPTPEATQAA